MIIRQAKEEDLAEIFAIYEYARQFMRKTGNPTQWGTSRPSEAVIREDIAKKRNYVVEDGDGIQGVFAFIQGVDPTYLHIEDGAWLNEEPYGTIHRIAGAGRKKGVFAEALAFCEAQCSNIRIDTHADNKVMQSVLARHGFVKCGRIYVDDGTARVAYQKVV